MNRIEKGELRLTGGERRGAKLFTVPTDDVRPALARLRKSLFDIVGPRVEGCVVVDLFGGTGSLAFEALSRGASRAILFETNPACGAAIRKNAEKLKYADRTQLYEETAFDAAQRLKFNGIEAGLVFVAPPYALYKEEGKWDRLCETIAAMPVTPDGDVIVEHRKRFDPPETIGALSLHRTKTYGGTHISIYRTILPGPPTTER